MLSLLTCFHLWINREAVLTGQRKGWLSSLLNVRTEKFCPPPLSKRKRTETYWALEIDALMGMTHLSLVRKDMSLEMRAMG